MNLLDQEWPWWFSGPFSAARICPLCAALVNDPVVHADWHDGKHEEDR